MRPTWLMLWASLVGVAILSAPVFADGQLFRTGRGGLRHIEYDLRTDEWHYIDSATTTRAVVPVWDSTATSGYFLNTSNTVVLDWGDIADGTRVDRFVFAYSTVGEFPLDAEFVFYVNENGRRSQDRIPIAAFRLEGLPPTPSDPNILYLGVAVHLELSEPVVFTGPDLDPNDFDPADPNGYIAICGNGDGLTDFGYSIRFLAPPGKTVGPLIASVRPDLPPCPAPGIRDEIDLYLPDPNNPPAPGEPVLPDVNAVYQGTFDFGFGSSPFAQFWLQLSLNDPNVPCRRLGCERADIQPPGGDCDVDLSDLSVLLANFATPNGATRENGDIEPPDGDGDVDLSDLALMLSDFGTDCN